MTCTGSGHAGQLTGFDEKFISLFCLTCMHTLIFTRGENISLTLPDHEGEQND